MLIIGVDVGGMSIKAGIVNDNGKIIDKQVCKTSPTSDKCIADIKNLIKTLLEKNNIKKEDVLGVGFGFPGTVSSATGFVDFLPNMNWRNVDFASEMKDINLPIKISNDANVATLGEIKFGAGKGCKNAVMLTIGTGVGGGIVIDGKLFEGVESKGAELGHTTLILGGEQCGCGRRGCVEAYVSASALIRDTISAMKKDKNSLLWQICGGSLENVNGITFFEAVDKNDECAKKVYKQYISYLSETIMNFCNIFRPEIILLGGGISAQGDKLINPIKEYCKEFDYGYKGAPIPEIRVASNGNDAGIIGAASLFVD